MVERFLKLTAENMLTVVSIPEVRDKEQDGRFNQFVHNEIDCDIYECVYLQIMADQDIVMLVDENGILRQKPINIFPWVLYSECDFNSPIVGDVLFVGLHRVGELDELDFCGLTQKQIDYMTDLFNRFAF